MSRILVLLAIFFAAVATASGFGWINVEHYSGWLAASLLSYFVSLVVEG